MEAYIYNADIYCRDCALEIRAAIREEGKQTGIDIDKSDSDNWPQGPYPDGGGEADCPQHCACGSDCLNSIQLDNGQKVGCFLENPITPDGEAYIKEHLWQIGSPFHNGQVVELWADYYGIEYTNGSSNCEDSQGEE